MLDFIGIGAQKAGTTWLYERLRTHPEIYFPHVKEIGFWDTHYPRSLQDPTYEKNLVWYRSLFDHWEGTKKNIGLLERKQPLATYQRNWFDRLMLALDRSQSAKPAQPQSGTKLPTIKLGEISPTYCYFEEPSTIRAIRDFAPGLRIIYSIRHPFNRAWSSALMALRRAEMSAGDASDQWFIDHFRSRLSLKYGDYERAMEEWLAVFPREQFLLLRFEDIPTDPRGVLKQCVQHIGVRDTNYFDDADVARLSEKVFSNSGSDLRPTLIPVLEELYAEKIAQLKSRHGIEYGDYRSSHHSVVA